MVNKILKAPEGPPSDVERIKDESNYLRGTLGETMLDRISSGRDRTLWSPSSR